MIYNNYEIILYNLEQKIYDLLSLQINSFTVFISFLILCIGLLTSFTPCFISLLPLTVAYINTRNKSNFSKNIFFCGLITSLCFIIFISNFININYSYYINSIPIFSSLILLLISLNLLQIFNFSYYFTFINIFLSGININNLFFKSYFFGCLIGFSTFPCSTSIIMLFIFWLSHATNFFILLFYLVIYLLGCILPFILFVNLSINYIESFFIFYLWNWIVPISGSIILFMSLFSLLEKILI
uniref:Thiol:disulfide interchange protein n=1 Tax=Erythroglossum lusitanicum TaxID=2575615 RepID=A0A4D6WY40_9FLOR|nr:Thiol:disulfide interchange protein [Erythroglossum lusitanicum]